MTVRLLIRIELLRGARDRRDHQLIDSARRSVERPKFAVLKFIENVMVRSRRIARVEEDRDDHATFRNIYRLSVAIIKCWYHLRPAGYWN